VNDSSTPVVGDIVIGTLHTEPAWVGKIVKITSNWRGGSFYHIRYMEIDGSEVVCPDSRCVDGCVICGRAETADNIRVLPIAEVEELFNIGGTYA
jgi:hypothetical protein